MNRKAHHRVLIVVLALTAGIASAIEPRAPELPPLVPRSAKGLPSLVRPTSPQMTAPAREAPAFSRESLTLGSQQQPMEAAPYSECSEPATIEAAIVGGVIDPSRLGFALNVPRDGWSVGFIGFQPLWSCDQTGGGGAPTFAANSSLTHLASKSYVSLNQTTSPTEIAAVLEPYGTSFGWNGYRYDAFVGWYSWYGSSNAIGEEVLTDLISSLAPDLSLDCFHRRTQGSWADLPALGIGDPRSVVPSDFAEQYFQLDYLAAPRRVCGSAPPPVGTNFSASFWRESDTSWVYTSAWEYNSEWWPQPAAGYIDANMAYWSNERYWFTVSAGGEWLSNGSGIERIKEIAKGVDPSVDFTCFVATTPLTAAEVTGLGFHVPAPPSGYRESAAWLNRQGASALCADAPPPIYTMFWSFTNESDGLFIDAGMWHDGATGPLTPAGSISDGYLWWNDALGTYYSLYGYSSTGAAPPSRETLLEMAKGMDPTLDPTQLYGWQPLQASGSQRRAPSIPSPDARRGAFQPRHEP